MVASSLPSSESRLRVDPLIKEEQVNCSTPVTEGEEGEIENRRESIKDSELVVDVETGTDGGESLSKCFQNSLFFKAGRVSPSESPSFSSYKIITFN